MMLENFCNCVETTEVYNYMVVSCVIGWMIGIATQKLGAIWKARRVSGE